MIVALVFVLAVEVLVLVELLVPRKYKKPTRLVLMPVIWIVSLLPGMVVGVIAGITASTTFFGYHLSNGFALSETMNHLKQKVREFSTKW